MSGNFSRAKFDAFVAALGLKHFSPAELLVGQYKPRNGPPPEELWGNMVPTIIVLEALREHYGKSVQLLSGYRTELCNDPTLSNNPQRAEKSLHQAYSAFDFRIAEVKKDDIVRKLEEWESSRWFFSPVGFARKSVKLAVSGETVRVDVLPQVFSFGTLGAWGLLPACAFQFKGYWCSYATKNFVHFDTRGLIGSGRCKRNDKEE